MKRRGLFRVVFGVALAFTVLFNGCDTILNGNTTTEGLEGEWEGESKLGDPVVVVMIISGSTMTLESFGSKSKGVYETKDGRIIYRSTHIYDNDKKQFIETAEYVEQLKKEYLDELETGYITQEEYDAAAANAENLFAIPEKEIIPYRLEGNNTLILTMDYGDVVLTRR